MSEALIAPGENVHLQTHRTLGPFEHLLWLVDQWTRRHFILVARVEGASIMLDDLRSALLESQRRHLILRTTIQVNGDQRAHTAGDQPERIVSTGLTASPNPV